MRYTESFGRWCDISVLKLSSDGEIEWYRTYGGDYDDYGWAVQQTKDGGYIVGGDTDFVGAGQLPGSQTL